jgi:hypothetical protein
VFKSTVFVFLEPSQVIILLSPLIFFICFTNRLKTLIFIFTFLLLIFQQSLILIVFILHTLFIINKKLFYGFIIIIIFYILNNNELNYYHDRLNIYQYNDNLSLLSYISAFKHSINLLIYTNGFGIGFQQLGFVDKNLGINPESTLNNFDGSCLAFKIISEFGKIFH